MVTQNTPTLYEMIYYGAHCQKFSYCDSNFPMFEIKSSSNKVGNRSHTPLLITHGLNTLSSTFLLPAMRFGFKHWKILQAFNKHPQS